MRQAEPAESRPGRYLMDVPKPEDCTKRDRSSLYPSHFPLDSLRSHQVLSQDENESLSLC